MRTSSLKGKKASLAKVASPTRDWCNLSKTGLTCRILWVTVLSTSKNVIMLEPEGGKTYNEAVSLCKSICGRIYFPSTPAENYEVFDLANLDIKDLLHGDIWLRLSDKDSEDIWLDPENRENLTFKNWENKELHASFYGNYGTWNTGNWKAFDASIPMHHVICEF